MSDSSDEENRWRAARRVAQREYRFDREVQGAVIPDSSPSSDSSHSSNSRERAVKRRRVDEDITDDESSEPSEFSHSSHSRSDNDLHVQTGGSESASVSGASDGPPSPGQANEANEGADSDNSDAESGGGSEASEASEASTHQSEASSNESSDEDEDMLQDELLYHGATLTIAQSLMAILTFALAHSLTGVCIGDLLTLIALHCPQPNNCVPSLYKFKKFFKDIGRSVLLLHYFCEICHSGVPSKNSQCFRCGVKTDIAYFIEIPLVMQLQRMFERPDFFNDLQYRFNRAKKHLANVEVVYDGNVYKSQMENNGFLSNLSNISFMWYSDGISIFHSSKFSIWPLYFVINELPFKKRILKDNIVLGGLWFGSVKPRVNLFLEPFHQSLSHFRDHGHLFDVPDHEPVLVKGKMLYGTCDLQAKAIFLRMKASNGYYGCSKCKSKGERVPAGGTTVHVHQYNINNMPLRSNEEVAVFSEQAVVYNGSRFGVKGPSILYDMMENMILGTGIDVMHGIFLGVFKTMVKLWFDVSFSGEAFSIAGLVDLVDERLQRIKPPGFIKRMPRSIKLNIKLWKALEFKLFFYYYAVLVLEGMWEDHRYFNHFLKLVSAMYFLSQRSIFPEQLDDAQRLLQEFVHEFQGLYGLRYMGMNVHQLLHLVDCVRDNGPTWAYSCFFLEDLNGGLANLIHGTRHAGMQVCSSATRYMSLSTMIGELPPESEVRKFCEKISCKSALRHKIAETVSPELKILGKYHYSALEDIPDVIRHAINERFQIVDGHFQYFTRISNYGKPVLSEHLNDKILRTSSYHVVVTVDENPLLSKVLFFLRHSSCDCVNVCACLPARFIAVVQIYERVPCFINNIPGVRLPYISQVYATDSIGAVDITTDLKYPCFFMKFDEKEYMASPVNLLEVE